MGRAHKNYVLFYYYIKNKLYLVWKYVRRGSILIKILMWKSVIHLNIETDELYRNILTILRRDGIGFIGFLFNQPKLAIKTHYVGPPSKQPTNG